MNFTMKLFGWKPSSFEIYRDVFYRYGGSINMHPDVVELFLKKMHLSFYHLEKDDEIVAAYFTSEAGGVGLNVWQEYPVSYDEVLIPIKPSTRIIFPHKNNRLSWYHNKIISNSFYAFRKKRQVCIIKGGFSNKTIRKRNNAQRNFISEGGEFISLKSMSSGDIADIYVYLFKKRFASDVRCYGKDKIKEFIDSVPNLVTGNCLFYRGEPGAIDLVFHAVNSKFVYFDVPNGGLNPDLLKFSPGSLLMWKNIRDARELCERLDKMMHYSIGLYEKKWDYKLMWANVFPTGKSLML